MPVSFHGPDFRTSEGEMAAPMFFLGRLAASRLRVALAKSPIMNQRIPWKRIIAEGTIIVASILLAFSIDAWWSERQMRADEREAIDQLIEDFRANAEHLQTIRGMHEAALDAAYEILARGGYGGQSTSNAATAELVYKSLRAWTYDPLLGATNSLIQSGKLNILRNNKLRIALAAWPDIVADLTYDEWTENRNTFERIGPYLISKNAIYDALRSAGRLRRLDAEPRSDLSELASDPVFLNLMSWRVNNLENLLDEVDIVEASIQEILELLDDPNAKFEQQ